MTYCIICQMLLMHWTYNKISLVWILSPWVIDAAHTSNVRDETQSHAAGVIGRRIVEWLTGGVCACVCVCVWLGTTTTPGEWWRCCCLCGGVVCCRCVVCLSVPWCSHCCFAVSQKVICNGFDKIDEKVVSSCLLQCKPVCVRNFDKFCRKMLKVEV